MDVALQDLELHRLRTMSAADKLRRVEALFRDARELVEAGYMKPLDRLTPGEGAVYDDLRSNRLGTRVRLEQERIGAHFLKRALSSSITPA